MSRVNDAVQLFDNGHLCSQAVFKVFCEDFGLPASEAFKIGACFGSGMRQGEVCGACTGALMVLGLKYGDDKAKCGEVSDEFFEEFKKENGSFICRDLLGCDISTPEGVRSARDQNLFRELCPKMVASAVEITEKIMEK
ncbi:MAG: C_GCAxxG_C_C family protein [Methanobrevibacter sp.]|uniref:C-GCAxxG-C-C family protein n=1 Tax=Methanobrevibacter sp. TaxID=66852 RepID=UPI001B077CC8|nr:C-GCAxxG-C-C family protein [Methanobrevibacter sp.]MBO5152610.1 C_GCAxxG_C_C family protein [Methanobrevibacter sp.]MBO6111131.1 C_GCAxxG_C_C family protein [Methanobrevibacter sp.]